jgi:hypothetical protein
MGKLNEITEENFEAVKAFLSAVEQLYKDKSTIENLRLKTKTAGLLAELYVVDKLYERYHEGYKLFWLGGGKRYKDIELVNKKKDKEVYGVQVKSITKNIMPEDACCGKSGCYGYMIRHDSWSKYGERTKEGYLQLDVNQVKEGDVKLRKKFEYPFIFVLLEDIGNPQFFVYSREEMSNSWDQLVCGHNVFLKRDLDGNTTNTHFCIDPVGHKDQFDKIFE